MTARIDTPLKPREVLAEYAWLASWGICDEQIARQLGITAMALEQILRRHGHERQPAS